MMWRCFLVELGVGLILGAGLGCHQARTSGAREKTEIPGTSTRLDEGRAFWAQVRLTGWDLPLPTGETPVSVHVAINGRFGGSCRLDRTPKSCPELDGIEVWPGSIGLQVTVSCHSPGKGPLCERIYFERFEIQPREVVSFNVGRSIGSQNPKEYLKRKPGKPLRSACLQSLEALAGAA